jgi:uncharacterized membrane protein
VPVCWLLASSDSVVIIKKTHDRVYDHSSSLSSVVVVVVGVNRERLVKTDARTRPMIAGLVVAVRCGVVVSNIKMKRKKNNILVHCTA